MTTCAKSTLSFSSLTATSELGPITNWPTEVHDAQLKSLNFLTSNEVEERRKKISVQQGKIDARRRNRNLRRLNRLIAKEAEYREQFDCEIEQSRPQIESFASKSDLARDNVLDITELRIPKKATPSVRKIRPITTVQALPVKSAFLSYQGTNQ